MSGSPFGAPNGQQRTDRMHVDTRLVHATCSSNTPTTIAYATPQDLTPFSAVSSFNYPATADSTLLTPVSGPGSPPIQQTAQKQLRQTYHPSTSSAQQPTPPGSSRMFYGPYDMGVSSQASSPINTIHAQPESHFDIAYMGGASPKDSAPVPYYGHYGVSEPATESEYPAPGQTSNYQGYVGVEPSFFLKANPDSPLPGRNGIVSTTAGPTNAPILAEPQPSMLRNSRPSTIQELRDPTMLQPIAPGRPGQTLRSTAADKDAKKTRERSKKSKGNSRAPKPPSVHSSSSHVPRPVQGAVPQLMLSDKASEEERYLFDLRKKLVDEKGKGMWDQLKSGYEERFGCTKEKAALQMKISRAVCKHAIWPEGEKDILRQAFFYEEERRYARIIARMKELGGAQIWEWKPQHIESQLVKMGLEEPTMDEATKLRRRNRLAQRKRAAQQQQQHNAMMSWGRPVDMSHAQYPFPHHMTAPPTTYEVMPGTTMALSDEPEYTTEQEDQVLDQLDRKYAVKEESHSPAFTSTPEMMDMTFTRSDMGHSQHVGSHQSERVARQACEQLIAHSRLQNRPFAPSG